MQGLFAKGGRRGGKLSAEKTSIEDAEGMDENIVESMDDDDKTGGLKSEKTTWKDW